MSQSLITADTPLCLGFRHKAHRDPFRGQVGVVLLFNRLLTAAEQTELENYLVLKWTQPPATADQPFAEATFEVAPSGTLDLVDGDLSQLTLVPTVDPQTLRGTFLIASGYITAKPALTELPDYFRIYQRGNDLMLSSSSGTILLIR